MVTTTVFLQFTHIHVRDAFFDKNGYLGIGKTSHQYKCRQPTRWIFLIIRKNVPNTFGPPKGIYDEFYGQYLVNNVLILVSNKLHMDAHLWIERTLLMPNIL